MDLETSALISSSKGGLAQPGFTLFAPMYDGGSVFLVDMEGEVAHRWAMPYRPGLYAYLLDSGYLFSGGKIMGDLDRFESCPRFKAGAAQCRSRRLRGAVAGPPPAQRAH